MSTCVAYYKTGAHTGRRCEAAVNQEGHRCAQHARSDACTDMLAVAQRVHREFGCAPLYLTQALWWEFFDHANANGRMDAGDFPMRYIALVYEYVTTQNPDEFQIKQNRRDWLEQHRIIERYIIGM